MAGLPPGDPTLVAMIVNHLKSQGLFDKFRKDSLADVDTKPAYQNLRQRVDNFVSNHLAGHTWSPHLNKNQLRNNIRQLVLQSGMLEAGVDRIVSQVIDQKITHIFRPQVEKAVHEFLATLSKKDESPVNTAQAEDSQDSISATQGIVTPGPSSASDALSILDTITSLNEEASAVRTSSENVVSKNSEKSSKKSLLQQFASTLLERERCLEEGQESDKCVSEPLLEVGGAALQVETLELGCADEDLRIFVKEPNCLTQSSKEIMEENEEQFKIPEKTDKKLDNTEKGEKKEERKEKVPDKKTDSTKKADDIVRLKESESEPVKQVLPEKGSAKQKVKERLKEEYSLEDSDFDGLSDITVSSVHTSDLSSFEGESEEEIPVSDSTEEGEITSDEEEKKKQPEGQEDKKVKRGRHAYIHKPYLYSKYYSDSDDELTVEQHRQSVAREKEERLLRRQRNRERLEEKRKQKAAEKAVYLKMKSQVKTGMDQRDSPSPGSCEAKQPSIKEALKEQKILEKKVVLSKKRRTDTRPPDDCRKRKRERVEDSSKEVQKLAENNEKTMPSSLKDAKYAHSKSETPKSSKKQEPILVTEENKNDHDADSELKRKKSTSSVHTLQAELSAHILEIKEPKKHSSKPKNDSSIIGDTNEEQQKQRTIPKTDRHSRRESNDSEIQGVRSIYRKDVKSHHKNEKDKIFLEDKNVSRHRPKNGSTQRLGEETEPRSDRCFKSEEIHLKDTSQLKFFSEDKYDRKSKHRSDMRVPIVNKDIKGSESGLKHEEISPKDKKDRHLSHERSRSEHKSRSEKPTPDKLHKSESSAKHQLTASHKKTESSSEDRSDLDSVISESRSRVEKSSNKDSKRKSKSPLEDKYSGKHKYRIHSKQRKGVECRSRSEGSHKGEKEKSSTDADSVVYARSKSLDKTEGSTVDHNLESSVSAANNTLRDDTSHKNAFTDKSVQKEKLKNSGRETVPSKTEKRLLGKGNISKDIKQSNKEARRREEVNKINEKELKETESTHVESNIPFDKKSTKKGDIPKRKEVASALAQASHTMEDKSTASLMDCSTLVLYEASKHLESMPVPQLLVEPMEVDLKSSSDSINLVQLRHGDNQTANESLKRKLGDHIPLLKLDSEDGTTNSEMELSETVINVNSAYKGVSQLHTLAPVKSDSEEVSNINSVRKREALHPVSRHDIDAIVKFATVKEGSGEQVWSHEADTADVSSRDKTEPDVCSFPIKDALEGSDLSKNGVEERCLTGKVSESSEYYCSKNTADTNKNAYLQVSESINGVGNASKFKMDALVHNSLQGSGSIPEMKESVSIPAQTKSVMETTVLHKVRNNLLPERGTVGDTAMQVGHGCVKKLLVLEETGTVGKPAVIREAPTIESPSMRYMLEITNPSQTKVVNEAWSAAEPVAVTSIKVETLNAVDKTITPLKEDTVEAAAQVLEAKAVEESAALSENVTMNAAAVSESSSALDSATLPSQAGKITDDVTVLTAPGEGGDMHEATVPQKARDAPGSTVSAASDNVEETTATADSRSKAGATVTTLSANSVENDVSLETGEIRVGSVPEAAAVSSVLSSLVEDAVSGQIETTVGSSTEADDVMDATVPAAVVGNEMVNTVSADICTGVDATVPAQKMGNLEATLPEEVGDADIAVVPQEHFGKATEQNEVMFARKVEVSNDSSAGARNVQGSQSMEEESSFIQDVRCRPEKSISYNSGDASEAHLEISAGCAEETVVQDYPDEAVVPNETGIAEECFANCESQNGNAALVQAAILGVEGAKVFDKTEGREKVAAVEDQRCRVARKAAVSDKEESPFKDANCTGETSHEGQIVDVDIATVHRNKLDECNYNLSKPPEHIDAPDKAVKIAEKSVVHDKLDSVVKDAVQEHNGCMGEVDLIAHGQKGLTQEVKIVDSDNSIVDRIEKDAFHKKEQCAEVSTGNTANEATVNALKCSMSVFDAVPVDTDREGVVVECAVRDEERSSGAESRNVVKAEPVETLHCVVNENVNNAVSSTVAKTAGDHLCTSSKVLIQATVEDNSGIVDKASKENASAGLFMKDYRGMIDTTNKKNTGDGTDPLSHQEVLGTVGIISEEGHKSTEDINHELNSLSEHVGAAGSVPSQVPKASLCHISEHEGEKYKDDLKEQNCKSVKNVEVSDTDAKPFHTNTTGDSVKPHELNAAVQEISDSSAAVLHESVLLSEERTKCFSQESTEITDRLTVISDGRVSSDPEFHRTLLDCNTVTLLPHCDKLSAATGRIEKKRPREDETAEGDLKVTELPKDTTGSKSEESMEPEKKRVKVEPAKEEEDEEEEEGDDDDEEEEEEEKPTRATTRSASKLEAQRNRPSTRAVAAKLSSDAPRSREHRSLSTVKERSSSSSSSSSETRVAKSSQPVSSTRSKVQPASGAKQGRKREASPSPLRTRGQQKMDETPAKRAKR